MLTKILVGVLAVVLIASGGYLLWKSFVGHTETLPPATPPVPVPEVSTYASSTLGFSVTYPKDYSVNDTYAYDQFGEKKLIHGVKFTIPETAATGTNLSQDSGVSVEWLPRAQSCTGDIYLTADVKAVTLTDGGTAYSVATSSGAGAGNFYEEMVYAIASSSPCTAVRYFIHSTNIGNYEPGTVQEFDREKLIQQFDTIRNSLKLGV